MKTANTAIFIGALVCGLFSVRAPIYAQPTPTSASSTSQPKMSSPTTRSPITSAPAKSAPIAVEGGDDKPWNRSVPVATRQAARDLFLEGNKLFNIPLFTQAAEKYIAAIAKWKHPAFYFNLSIAQLNLGQEVEAHEHLKLAMQQGAEPLGAEQFQEAQKQLQDLEHQLGRIRITCPTPGSEVAMDGAPLFTGPGSYDGWVKATNHEITARKPTFVPQAKRVAVSPGKLETLDLTLRKLIEDRPWAVWKPWAVVGAGVAVVATSGGLHAVAAGHFRNYDDKFLKLPCANKGCTDQEIRDKDPSLLPLYNRAKLEQKIAIGGYIAGGSLIAAGVVLVYLNRPHLVEQEATNSHATGIVVVPTVSTDMLGVLVTVSH